MPQAHAAVDFFASCLQLLVFAVERITAVAFRRLAAIASLCMLRVFAVERLADDPFLFESCLQLRVFAYLLIRHA